MVLVLMVATITMAFCVGSQPVQLVWIGLNWWDGSDHYLGVTRREIAIRVTVFVGSIIGLWLIWDSAVSHAANPLPDWANSIVLAVLVGVVVVTGFGCALFATCNGDKLRMKVRDLVRMR